MLKLAYFLRKIQTLRVNNSRILLIKNAKFEYMARFSNLHWCTFKQATYIRYVLAKLSKSVQISTLTYSDFFL